MAEFPAVQDTTEILAVSAGDVDTNPQIPDDLVEVGQITYGDRTFQVTVGRNQELFEALVVNARQAKMLRMVPKDAASRFNSVESGENWYDQGRFLVTFWEVGSGDVVSESPAAIVWFGGSPLQKEVDKLKDAAGKHMDTMPELRQPGATIDFEVPDATNDTFAIRVFEGYDSSDMPRPPEETASFARRTMQEGEALYVQHLMAADNFTEGQRVWLETNLYKPGQEADVADPQLNGSVYLYRNAGYEDLGTYFNPNPKIPEWRIAMTKALAADLGTLALPGAVAIGEIEV